MGGFDVENVAEIRGSPDADHKILMDPAADQIHIRPGDDPGDAYVIINSSDATGTYPLIISETHEGGMLGYAANAWRYMYAKFALDDDGILSSYDEIDDLDVLDKLRVWKKEGKTQRDEDGFPILDYNTIPDFLKGPIPKGKTKRKYIRASQMAAFSWGAIRQLHQKVKDLEAIILKLTEKQHI